MKIIALQELKLHGINMVLSSLDIRKPNVLRMTGVFFASELAGTIAQ